MTDVDKCKDCGALTVFDDLYGRPQCTVCFDKAHVRPACVVCGEPAPAPERHQRPTCDRCRLRVGR